MTFNISYILLVLMVVNTLFSHGFGQLNKCGINSIYSFGDSIADTGNIIREGLAGAFSASSRLPYGETYFYRATGRCSNGRLIIDFLAMDLNLPLVNPYLERGVSFDHGVNFAVAGATALGVSFFENRNIQLPRVRSSLEVQLGRFKTYLNSICFSQTECAKRLDSSLFLLGEIGGNDYNNAFFNGKTIEEVSTYVPKVVLTIKKAARELIHAGAVRMVVPGNFPIGCFPIYLNFFRNSAPSRYDGRGCLKDLNQFSQVHNVHLQRAVEELRQEYPHVLIAYADYYNSLMDIIDNSIPLGFRADSLAKACCGIGGNYNFDTSRMCGSQGVPVCPDPARHIHWDGIHLTQRTYQLMAERLVRGGFTNPESDAQKIWNCS